MPKERKVQLEDQVPQEDKDFRVLKELRVQQVLKVLREDKV